MLDQVMPPTYGSLLRAWRTARGKSQQTLSEDARVSTRHLSFVETGRSQPSRELVLALAAALAVPFREQNAMLQAAGYAPAYRETALDAEPMADVRRAVSLILEAHEPNPALLVNRRYDVLMANAPAVELLAFFAPQWRGKNNIARMLASSEGLRGAIENWSEIARSVFRHLVAELSVTGVRDAEDRAILEIARAMMAELGEGSSSAARSSAVVVPLALRRQGVSVNLFTAITTLGTPLDITLQELRIESLFPADAQSRAALSRLTLGGLVDDGPG